MADEDRDPVLPDANLAPLGWKEWFWQLLKPSIRLLQTSVIKACLFVQTSFHSVFIFFYSLLVPYQLPITDPRADVRDFLERLHNKYGEQNIVLPLFIDDSYEAALRRARRDLRLIVVYLHQAASPTTDAFLQEFLLTNNFHDFLHQNDSLLWGASSQSGEGQRVARQLKVARFPFLGLVAPVPEGLTGSGAMLQCIFRQSGGGIPPDETFASLYGVIESVRPHMQTLIEERIRRDHDRKLQQEQEKEYAKSLEADRVKQLERERKLKAEKDVERERLLEQQKLERRRELLASKRKEIMLPSEPPAGEQRVQLRVRYPSTSASANSVTRTRAFNLDDRLEDLFNFVLLDEENCPEDFTIVHSTPSTTLPNCAPLWYKKEFDEKGEKKLASEGEESQSFRTAGFKPGGYVLIVRDNDA